jgi:predicted nuclease of predicted toxin-antitoxin system
LIRLLLDEHVSPSLVGKLGDKGLFAVAAAHVGLSGEPDEQIWHYALENDFVVVTSNARDFIRLLNVEVHPGLIVLRESGLTRDEQWDRIRPVIEHVLESSDDNFLVNKLVEISDVDEWEIREIPER